MIVRSIISRLSAQLREFRNASGGNMVMMFAIALVPIVGSVGAAVDYGQANSFKTAMQAAADAASLGTIKVASTLSAVQIQSTAQALFNASFNRAQVTPAVNASYDAGSNTVTVTASAGFAPSLMKIVGVSQINISARSKATIGAKTWEVCVLVTDPDSNHTLLVKNDSGIDFTNCMVQVNTQNWDAVEARDTSYIHSTNGDNCFVGDIHYGDITPPKDPTCTLLNDPYASYVVPTSSCDYTNLTVKTATTLNPGTYCGGVTINASTTFSPGMYTMKGGDLAISGTGVNVVAKGVTFLLTGKGAGVTINTTGAITMSPASAGTAGQFDGFVFYLDQSGSGGAYLSQSKIQATTMTASGVFYLKGQQLIISNKANVTVNPGSIIAGFILPDTGSYLNLTGTINSPSAALAALKKTGATSGGPVLVN